MKTIQKISICLASLILMWPSISQAQQSFSGGFGHFYAGQTWLNNAEVNNYITTLGFHAIPNQALMMGGAGAGVINNFMIGGEGGFIAPSSTLSVTGEASLTAGYGMFTFGYTMPSRGSWVFYPQVGMGWGGSSLIYTFYDGIQYSYTSSGFFLSTSLHCDLFAGIKDEGNTKYGFKTGLSAGYLFNPQAAPWKHADGGPALFGNSFFDGFFVKLTIGGGALGAK